MNNVDEAKTMEKEEEEEEVEKKENSLFIYEILRQVEAAILISGDEEGSNLSNTTIQQQQQQRKKWNLKSLEESYLDNNNNNNNDNKSDAFPSTTITIKDRSDGDKIIEFLFTKIFSSFLFCEKNPHCLLLAIQILRDCIPIVVQTNTGGEVSAVTVTSSEGFGINNTNNNKNDGSFVLKKEKKRDIVFTSFITYNKRFDLIQLLLHLNNNLVNQYKYHNNNNNNNVAFITTMNTINIIIYAVRKFIIELLLHLEFIDKDILCNDQRKNELIKQERYENDEENNNNNNNNIIIVECTLWFNVMISILLMSTSTSASRELLVSVFSTILREKWCRYLPERGEAGIAKDNDNDNGNNDNSSMEEDDTDACINEAIIPGIISGDVCFLFLVYNLEAILNAAIIDGDESLIPIPFVPLIYDLIRYCFERESEDENKTIHSNIILQISRRLKQSFNFELEKIPQNDNNTNDDNDNDNENGVVGLNIGLNKKLLSTISNFFLNKKDDKKKSFFSVVKKTIITDDVSVELLVDETTVLQFFKILALVLDNTELYLEESMVKVKLNYIEVALLNALAVLNMSLFFYHSKDKDGNHNNHHHESNPFLETRNGIQSLSKQVVRLSLDLLWSSLFHILNNLSHHDDKYNCKEILNKFTVEIKRTVVSSSSLICELTVKILGEQDDLLIHTLQNHLLSFCLFEEKKQALTSTLTKPTVDKEEKDLSSLELIFQNMNPHVLFIHFLAEIRFDVLLVLDFLISSETCMLEYLTRYLKFMITRWNTKTSNKILQSDFGDILSVNRFTEEAIQVKETEKEKKERFIPLLPHQILYEQYKNKNVLEEIISIFEKLLFKLELLEDKDIIPFNPKPLLLRLRQVLELDIRRQNTTSNSSRDR